MKRIVCAMAAGIAIFMSISCLAYSTSKIKKDIDKLITHTDNSLNIGVVIKDLSTNKFLYLRNAKRHFVPASNLKLYSNAAALISLGPDFHYPTRLTTDGLTIDKSTLQGNLALVLSGSPSFSADDLTNLLDSLARYGIKRIDGDFVVTSSRANMQPYGPGWMLDDLSFYYGAPLTPLIIDGNSVSVTLNPGANVGDKARVSLLDPSGSIQVDNQVLTKQANTACRPRYAMNKNNTLTVSGCMALGGNARMEDVAIAAPLDYLTALLHAKLAARGISLSGKVTLGRLKHQKVLAKISSPSLATLLKQTLKPSNNLYADTLFLTVGEHYFKQAVSFKKSGAAVKAILRDYAGVKLANSVMVDGSGLSRYDLVSPLDTVELLAYLYKQFPVAYEFIAALPIAGRDGTLHKRMLTSERRSLVRAKTGSMLGVTSLAGFLPTRNGHPLAFAIMSNGIPGNYHSSLKPYRQLEEKIANYLLDISVTTPLLQLRSKAHKRKPLPYETKLSYQRTVDEFERLNNRLEHAIRQAVLPAGLLVLKSGDTVTVVDGDKTKLTAKLLNKLAAAAKKYQAWVMVKTNSQPVIKAAKKSFATDRLLLTAAKQSQLTFQRNG